jgi:phosphate starvation-inducible PhoH-like protein
VVDINDAAARQAGPDKKSWHEHDLRHIKAMTENQDVAIQAWFATDEGHLALLGSAGTGKTLLATYLGSVSVTRKEQLRIVVIRAGVPKRDPGALPGTLEQKQAKFEAPYISCFHQLFGKASTYENMKEAKVVEFHTTSFIRGMTFDDSIIIVEECQNMDFDELDSVLTRPGINSRVILTGDTLRQCDLKHFETSGVQILEEVAHELEGMTLVQFTPDDCVRSGFAKSWLQATERFFTKERAQARNQRN